MSIRYGSLAELWNFRSRERNYPGTFAPKMGKTTTYTRLHADDLTVKTLMSFCGRWNCLSIHTAPSPDLSPGGEGDTPSPHPTLLSLIHPTHCLRCEGSEDYSERKKRKSPFSTTHSLQRTPANIRIKLTLLETRIPGLHFCR